MNKQEEAREDASGTAISFTEFDDLDTRAGEAPAG